MKMGMTEDKFQICRDCSKLTDVLLTHRRDAEGAESFQDFLRVLRASAVKVSRVSVAMLHCQFVLHFRERKNED